MKKILFRWFILISVIAIYLISCFYFINKAKAAGWISNNKPVLIYTDAEAIVITGKIKKKHVRKHKMHKVR
jgi:hypothetical protein